MAYEDSSTYDPQVSSALWNQFYANQSAPSGFELNQNQIMADALRGYGQDPYLSPVEYMPGYENTLTRKLIEKNAAGTTTQTQKSGGGMQMPNMNMMQAMMGASGGTGFGSAAGSKLPTEAAGVGGPLMDSNASFGSIGSAQVGETGGAATGTAATGAEGGSMLSGLGMGGGSYGGAAVGGLMGAYQGHQNYLNDPNMRNQKDNFGTAHRDYRAEVGGGTLGGVMGWYGGPIGAALAGPTVKAVHPFMEKGTRGVINFGDKVGGAGGAMMLDPIGTAASGKYKWGDVIGGGLLGPAYNLFK